MKKLLPVILLLAPLALCGSQFLSGAVPVFAVSLLSTPVVAGRPRSRVAVN